MNEPKLKPNEKYEARDLTKYLVGEVTEDEFQAFKNDPLTRVSCFLLMNLVFYFSIFLLSYTKFSHKYADFSELHEGLRAVNGYA